MILSAEVIAILILDFIFLFFSLIAFYLSIKIYFNWDINSTSTLQYKLEKQSSLAATIIKYIFIIKLPLFLFFIFTLDKISNVLTGAMCAAGVVDATVYGTYLFILKIVNIYIFGFWLMLHYIDIKDENLPFVKLKFKLFIFAFIVFIAEISLEFLMFSSIDVSKMVSCCGTLYSSSSTSVISNIFLIDTSVLLVIFYALFFVMFMAYIKKNRYIFGISNILFVIVSIISLISFFGTYIYELPTHHCPFCFLQKDYNYVGYLIYILLFLGTFYGISTIYVENRYKISLFFNFFYILLVSSYPILYYIKNGVWL
jgi:hypothetical protein